MGTTFVRKLASAGDVAKGLSTESRKALLTLLSDVRPFAARRDIISEGDRPEYVHIMIQGWACRYKVLKDGSRQITAFLLPGDFCDTHITMLGQMDHSIGTITGCRVALVSRQKMREMAGHAEIAYALWWASLVDEAVLRAWIVNLGRRDAFERVGNLICEIHERLKNVGMAADGTFELPLTQEEMADALGLTSVHVNRTLKRLREENLLTHRQRRIVITDVPRLERLVGFDASYLHLPNEETAPDRRAIR